MSEAARILATEALTEARAALADFAAAVERAMVGVDADVNRMTHWLQHERPVHWKHEVRVRENAVQAAKGAISRKQIIAAPEPASIVDERKALDRAKRKLAEAQRRQEATRRWGVSWERSAMVYKGAAHQLRQAAGGQIPSAIASITRMIESIEAYLSVAPPGGGGETARADEVGGEAEPGGGAAPASDSGAGA